MSTDSMRTADVQSPPSSYSENGEVGSMEAIDMSEAHESGNTFETTIDLVWITLK